ncbi:MAG: excinuclease ABC subunit UvrA [Candidatus Aminicenantes bacterium]|nr:excinuclease ABC subunit UvrA [Candidatus Aminicenantes bacterium]
MKEKILLRGVRVHNLKNIDLDIPLNKLIVMTGVSGSGKSSLAFDTLYAEGQRRYIESLSAYARQFLERMDKPDADRIEGITPAIAIQQKAVSKNPRSTVATVTEIYDFLRILFARIGLVHCLECGQPVVRDTIDSMTEDLYKRAKGQEILISFSAPPDVGSDDLRRAGFDRIILDRKIEDLKDSEATGEDTREILVDRLRLTVDERERLVDSLELALKKGKGKVSVLLGEEVLSFLDRLECRTCGIVFDDPLPTFFSFNSPQGACSSCHGFGDMAVYDEEKIIPDRTKSLIDGAVEPYSKPGSHRRQRRLLEEAGKRGIPTDRPFKDLEKESQRFVLEGDGRYGGVAGFFERLKKKNYKVQVRVFLARYRKYIPCPDCGQARLNPRALSITVGGLNIGKVTAQTVKEADMFFRELHLTPFQMQVVEKLVQEIRNRLNYLLEVGLDYLTLNRITFTLSGGEAQRINLAAALGSSLVGTLFVLDEPSIGLHARDSHRLVEILKSLQRIGNTVLIVEHDPEIMRAAEYCIDLGPHAGEQGGEVLFSGTLKALLKDPRSLTARYLRGEDVFPLPSHRRPPKGYLEIRGATLHNLKNIDVRLPLNVLACVTGVSGSGKSTLLHDVLFQGWAGRNKHGFKDIRGGEAVDRVILVDQSPLSASPRSIPATYTKAMDDIRILFSQTREAKSQNFKPGYFSFNTAGGRCEECKGAGRQLIEMQFLSDVVLICDSCKGKRFKREILDVHFRGKNIDDVLRMTILEGMDFFLDYSKIIKKLRPLIDVGLGYLRLGQPTTTLSGGEAQRMKLAFHLIHQKEKAILYLFDEPTIGLHPLDVAVLLQTLRRLVESGHSVLVIEHNLDLIRCADYIIDLGPEGGDRGGEIVAVGTPEAICRVEKSYTGAYLKKYLSSPVQSE